MWNALKLRNPPWDADLRRVNTGQIPRQSEVFATIIRVRQSYVACHHKCGWELCSSAFSRTCPLTPHFSQNTYRIISDGLENAILFLLSRLTPASPRSRNTCSWRTFKRFVKISRQSRPIWHRVASISFSSTQFYMSWIQLVSATLPGVGNT